MSKGYVRVTIEQDDGYVGESQSVTWYQEDDIAVKPGDVVQQLLEDMEIELPRERKNET